MKVCEGPAAGAGTALSMGQQGSMMKHRTTSPAVPSAGQTMPWCVRVCAVVLAAGLSSLATASRSPAADLAAAEPGSIRAALYDDATFTLHVRSYLFDQSHNEGDDPAAWAIGGWAGYQTGWIADILQFGVVAYTSQPLWAPPNRAGSLLLLPNQDGISVLGEAYAALRYDEQVLTIGRQMVHQPEINPHDNRMIPITHEGGSLEGDVGMLSYYAAFLTATKTRGSN